MDTEPDHVIEGWHAVVVGPPRSNPDWSIEVRPSRYTEFRYAEPEVDGLPGFHLDLGDRDTILPVEQVVRTGPDSFTAVTIPNGRSLEVRPFVEDDAMLMFAGDPDWAIPWPVPEIIERLDDWPGERPRLSVVYLSEGPSVSYAVGESAAGQVLAYLFRGVTGTYARMEDRWVPIPLEHDDVAGSFEFPCRELAIGAEALWRYERNGEGLPHIWEVPLLDGTYLDKDDFDDEWEYEDDQYEELDD